MIAKSSSKNIWMRVEKATGSTGKISVEHANSGADTVTTANAISDTNWHHLGVTWTTSNQNVWLDGDVGNKGTGTYTQSFFAPGGSPSWVMGCRGGGSLSASPSDFMDGNLAWVTFWNVELTQDEMLALAAGVNPLKVRPKAIVNCFPMWDPAALFDLAPASQRASATAAWTNNSATVGTGGAPVALWTPWPRSYVSEVAAAGGNVTVTPAAASLTLTGAAPTIVTPVTVTPPAASLTLTGAAPTVSTPVVATPAAASLAVTGAAPTVTTTANVVVTPPAASLALTGYVPTVSAPVTVTPPAASLTLTGQPPTVSTPVTVTPTAASLSLTGYAPVVSTPVVATPLAASLVLAGYAPTVTAGASVVLEPPAASLSLTGAAPTVTATGNVTVVPAAASLTVTGAVPTVTATGNVTVVPNSASLTLTGYIPTVTAGADVALEVPAATIILTGYAPTVLTPVVATPTAASLTATGYAPTIVLPVTVTPPFSTLNLTGQVPTVSVAGGFLGTPPAALLTLVGYAPTVTVPELATRRLLCIARGSDLDPALRAYMTQLETRFASQNYNITYLLDRDGYAQFRNSDDPGIISAAFAALSPPYDGARDTWFFFGHPRAIAFVMQECFDSSDAVFRSVGSATITRVETAPILPPVP